MELGITCPRQLEPPSPSNKIETDARKGTNGALSASGESSRAVSSSQSIKLQASVFGHGDQEKMKTKVRSSIMKPEAYDVTDFYSDFGLYAKIATHSYFENITLGVIAFNAIWMAIDTDHNPAESLLEAHPIFQIMEQFFCVYFSVELVIRFMAFETKFDFAGLTVPPWMKDPWFMFDSVLVALMVMETWIFSLIEAFGGGSGSPLAGNGALLRLFRLLRLSRLMRMLRSLPELMVLVKGMLTALTSVFYVMCLLLISLYVFSIAITQLSTGNEIADIYFGSVQETMYSLLIYATFLDNLSQFCDDIRLGGNWLVLILVWLFIGLACMCILNMLIGVLCEVISEVAEKERDQRKDEMIDEKMSKVVNELDTDRNNKITENEFREILRHKEIVKALEEIEVDPVGIVDFAELFFQDQDGKEVELSFESFMDNVKKLRGTKNATVKDVMTLWKQMSPKIHEIINDTTECDEKVEKIEKICGKGGDMFTVHAKNAEKVTNMLAALDKA